MNTAKIAILEETLKNRFNIDSYRKFTREFFNELKMFEESKKIGIWREYSDNIISYYTIGQYTDNQDNGVLIMAVELKNESSVERARSMQRNFISKVLDENNLDAAIVAFYSEGEPSWRLSFVRLDYTFTDKGLDIELTPAKRYSYLVGESEPSYTAQTQLLKILEDDKYNPSLDEIEEAFSVERVTKDFFIQYKEKYLNLKEYLEKNEEFIEESKKLGFQPHKFSEQFAKKLMGQLAFLYFIQKKGWLGVGIVPKKISKKDLTYVYNSVDNVKKEVLKKVYYKLNDNEYRIDSDLLGTDKFSEHESDHLSDIFIDNNKYNKPWGSGSRTFIRSILWKHCDNNDRNFFDKYLEPFFYEALNTKRKNQYFKTFNSKVPFLNGGLFEPLEGYHWKDTNFEIPNEFFSNKEKKTREADGILDIFDRYNFTINENEPLEKEVAVDPEMLGKIFENLLDINDRKSKGAFYTPREIVHYMCQESLINYLVDEVEVPYEDMKQFILYGEIIKDEDSRRVTSSSIGFHENKTIKQSIFDNIVDIDNALQNVKVADPAVGSGAFPLGMLNEIVKARDNITEYIIKKDKEGALNKRYGEAFIRNWRSSYKMKWNTIKNSIFAVDIEPSAVDITKLRLWLSVIVDQEINEEYSEPKPLPNLDMNIHIGNSLIDEYEGIKLFDETILSKSRQNNKDNSKDITLIKGMQLNILVDHTDEMLKEMFDLQDRYFDIDDDDVKKDIKQKIDNIQEELIKYKLNKDGNNGELKKYEESIKNREKPYFVWELEFAKVFKDNKGFDIVIGNPPYVGEKGNKEIFRPIAKTDFGKKHYVGKMDLFYFFFHKAIDIGREKAEISFITTNYYPTAYGGRKLRSDFKERTSIRKLINFNEMKIFESALGQHNLITMLVKENDQSLKSENILVEKTGVADTQVLSNIFNEKDKETKYYYVEQDKLYEGKEDYIRLIGVYNNTDGSSVQSILSKMKSCKTMFGDICMVKQGIVSGADKVTDKHKRDYGCDWVKGQGIFLLNKKEVEDLELSEFEQQFIKSVYKNSQIHKYFIEDNDDLYVMYITKTVDKSKIPNIIKYLEEFKPILENKRETRQGKLPWYSLHWPRESNIFEQNYKITNSRRSKSNIFALDTKKRYEQSDIMVSVVKEKYESKIEIKYLLSLLNSKLYSLWLQNQGKLKGKMFELYGTPLSEIPIKIIDIDEQQKFVKKVDAIIETKQENCNSSINDLMCKIDSMIYKLFELTEEEIEIIEDDHKENIDL